MTEAIQRAMDFLKARRDAGLSDQTMLVLVHLSLAGDGTKYCIAEATGINVTTLPRYLSTLVASGHLEKARGVDDAREVVFRLSEHGRRLVSTLLRNFAPDAPSEPCPPT